MNKSIPKCCYGTYETEFNRFINICSKNPRHVDFIPVNDFNINHLGEDYRDKDIVNFTKVAAGLTLKITARTVSKYRPEFWPNTNEPYPFYYSRGRDMMRVGTGRVYDVIKSNFRTVKCQCLKCQQSDSPSKVFGEISVITACHIVFDDSEAKETYCRLFYDHEDSPRVNLSKFTIIERNVEKEKCLMTCITCDVDLIDKLTDQLARFTTLSSHIHEKYKRNRDNSKIAIIISHPHGCEKQIAIGQWIDKFNENENGETQFTYTTQTCPGSSGSTVHIIGYKVEKDSPHLHSGVNSDGLNFSTVGKIVESKWTLATNDDETENKLTLRLGNKEILSASIDKGHCKITKVVNNTKIDIWTTHLRNEVTGRMETREEATIRKNYTYLVEELNINHLVPHLFEKDILGREEKAEIEREQIGRKRVELMLDKVMNACPDAFFVFLDGLTKDHQHVADKLKETYNSF